MSTNCKSCRQYYKIENQIGVSALSAPVSTLRIRESNDFNEPVDSTISETELPTVPEGSTDSVESNQQNEVENAPLNDQTEIVQNQSTATSQPPTYQEPQRYVAKEDANKYSKYKGDSRDKEIVCYDCHETHWIIQNATSSMCPHCGSYISLKDHEIHNRWNSSIKTRGNVAIYKKGVVKNISIHCNNLIIEGQFDAKIECAGDLIIRHETHLSSKVKCKRLLLERKVIVTSQLPIEADEALIDGALTSDIVCTDAISLSKHSKLIGNMKTKTVKMEVGAQHLGSIQMG